MLAKNIVAINKTQETAKNVLYYFFNLFALQLICIFVNLLVRYWNKSE